MTTKTEMSNVDIHSCNIVRCKMYEYGSACVCVYAHLHMRREVSVSVCACCVCLCEYIMCLCVCECGCMRLCKLFLYLACNHRYLFLHHSKQVPSHQLDILKKLNAQADN